ncbi:unnamed protein product [Timema podura]|uniref:Uncharacterized protein n=1 Tax=Timema podura TaxID=61482 RepID=A0ABN7NHT7_TIMPD|nr:unnamed protein product [Timema podura]
MPSKVSRGSILTSYKHKVEELRNLGRQWSLTEEEIDQVIQDSFSFLEEEIQNDGKLVTSCKKIQKQENKHSSIFNLSLKIMISVLLVAILFNILLSYHRPTYNFAVRNIQELIYPTMKLLRWVTLPLVKLFPSITVWYDELCLVENPYFQSVDIDCWACEDVRSVLDLSETDDPNLYQPHIGFPYIVKGGSAIVNYNQLEEMYLQNKLMMDTNAYRIKSSNSGWTTLADLMNHKLEQNPSPNQAEHVIWRLTRLEPTRALRKIFPRPSFVPTTVNVERFVLIDEPKAGAYVLPFPEGYKVFLMQGSGERLIILDPVPGCNSNCSRVSVLLKPSYFLYYNSWFYRPKSYPVENSTSISPCEKNVKHKNTMRIHEKRGRGQDTIWMTQEVGGPDKGVMEGEILLDRQRWRELIRKHPSQQVGGIPG